MTEKKETEKKSKKSKNFVKTLSKNYWAISTIVLAIILIVSLFMGGFTKTTVSSEAAGQKIVEFLSSQGTEAEVVSVSEVNGLYEVTLSANGEEGVLYITEDGNNLIPQPIPLTGNVVQEEPSQQTPTQTDIPKSDKPIVELYVWGYCPYGIQAQGPMAEVAKLLRDSADFTIVPYYAGHGPFEAQENKIESCIQKLEPEKYWDYAAGFVKTIYPKCSSVKTEECDLTESTALMKSLGIDSTAILICVDSDGDALNSAASQKAQANGVTGSPTVTINGVKAQVDRTAEGIKTAICSAFNTAPAECANELDSSAAAAAGSC